jgi:major type 1 subunit fimbrin (pilin)
MLVFIFLVVNLYFNSLLLGIEMKNKFKLMMSGVGLVSVLALPGLAQASDGTITFTGQLTASTCTISVNGAGSNGTVTLPTVSTSSLLANGDVAGATNYTIALSDCNFVAPLNSVTAFYETGSNVNPVSGNLINTNGDATNVEVQLLAADDLGTPIIIGSPSQSSATPISAASGNLNYVARYFATGITGPGTVNTQVTYSLVYQ